MSSPTFYIHVGYPKTGTTSIQSFMFRHRQLLRANGILYPETGLQWTAQHRLAGAFQSQKDRLYWLETDDTVDYVHLLEEEVDAAQPHSLFVSSEAFSFTKDIEAFKRRLATLTDHIRIVLFLRRQDLWVESAFTQLYKAGLIPFDFPLYSANKSRTDYNAIMKRWEAVFGLQAIDLFLVDPVYGYMDAVDAVIPLLGIDETNYPKEEESKNDRLTLHGLHLSAMIHVKRNGKLNGQFLADLEAYARAHPELRNYTFFAPGERHAYLRSFEAGNRELAQRYFGRDKLFSPVEENASLAYVDTQSAEKDISGALLYLFEKHGLYEG